VNQLRKIFVIFFIFATSAVASTSTNSIIKSSTETKIDSFCAKPINQENFCMEYKTSYPIVSSPDKYLQKEINKAIKSHIKTTNAKKYVLDYLEEMRGKVFSMGHSEENNIKILSVTKQTFTLSINNYNYSGGAHGNYGEIFENYDRKTGNILNLDQLFIPNYQEKFTKIANKVYRDSNGIMPNESLSKTMGWFEDNFILPSEIGIVENGLLLEYNPYEIRAYVYGPTSLLIPFSKLSTIVSKNSPIANLVSSAPLDRKSKNINKTFGEDESSQIRIKTTLISKNRLKIFIAIKNISDYKKGGLSISFPQLTSKKSVINKRASGFRRISLYPKASSIYNINEKKLIKAKYLLVEADTNRWKKGKWNDMTIILKLPSSLKTLYLNARATFSYKKDIKKIPNYNGVEGQQGFNNYRLAIPIVF